jgi:hypothetical protein
MTAIDFSRSFLMFRVDLEKSEIRTVTHKPPFTLNNARIQLDCRCQITELATGASQEFVLGASCKTERVGVESGIWTEPNADFVPIFSRDRFLTIKTFDHADRGVPYYPASRGMQSSRQSGTIADAGFDSVRIDLVSVPAEELESAARINEAILANAPIVAQTEVWNERYRAVLEYPAKTINANERDGIYQTDTGPVIFPDLTAEPASLIERFELAFCAFNAPTWTEFLVRAPTAVSEGVRVYHYCRSVRLEARNRLFRLIGDTR